MTTIPTFSILHTSARPAKWREVYQDWLAAADDPDSVEYVLCVDERWGFPPATDRMFKNMRAQDRLVYNGDRKCYVDGVNGAAGFASGAILIVNADDQYPCAHWDTRLKQAAADALAVPDRPFPNEFVLWANTGTPQEREREIVVMPIMSRARYDRLGYVFYPLYESMYADNDLCAHAKQDGALFTLPAEWVFPHRHPFFSGTAMDEAYEAQNRQEAYTLGADLFTRRRLARFNAVPPTGANGAGRKTLAVCMPGREFPLEFMSNWTDLLVKLIPYVNVTPIFGYAPDPSIVRHTMAGIIETECNPVPDFVLWIDSDNLPSFTHVMTCLKTLDERADVDAVAGWCWLLAPPGAISCGNVNADDSVTPFDFVEMMDGPADLIEVEYTGFPTIVMRRELLKKAGPFPFVPLVGDHYQNGKAGEDVSFCVRARAAGARILVDRRLRVPHLKLGALDAEVQARAIHAKGLGGEVSSIRDSQKIPVPAGEMIPTLKG